MECKNCRSTECATDAAQGAIYCVQCGMVQEESTIVSTLNFVNHTSSKSTLGGKIINIESTQIGTNYIDSSYYIKNTILNICTTLGLGQDHADRAYRWYKLSLQYNLSKGKSILYTLSACIYIVCRQEGTPHMIIDFSNALRIDCFKIGKSFLKLCTLLNIDIPLIDPSLYMPRFASKLKFSQEVLNLSLRLVSRMKRDWIVVGRRPNNICGAALLIASRVLNDERSIIDIAKAVHVSVPTINKRLREVSETESANLTVEEFNATWLNIEEDPPIIKATRMKVDKVDVNFTVPDLNPYSSPQSSVDEEVVSDDEIHNAILTAEEANDKKIMWEEMFGEYMRERELKVKSLRRVKRQSRKKYDNVKEALQCLDRKISTKLNYQAIESIFEKL